MQLLPDWKAGREDITARMTSEKNLPLNNKNLFWYLCLTKQAISADTTCYSGLEVKSIYFLLENYLKTTFDVPFFITIFFSCGNRTVFNLLAQWETLLLLYQIQLQQSCITIYLINLIYLFNTTFLQDGIKDNTAIKWWQHWKSVQSHIQHIPQYFTFTFQSGFNSMCGRSTVQN